LLLSLAVLKKENTSRLSLNIELELS